MFKNLTINRFFILIFATLLLTCLLVVGLLWVGFDDIENVESELLMQQKTVVVIKDIRFHAVQIQQLLTDVGATHRHQGFEAAVAELALAKQSLTELERLKPAILDSCREIDRLINASYGIGLKMANSYLENGIEAGNNAMIEFDVQNRKLTSELNRMAMEMDVELLLSAAKNDETLRNNRLILIGSIALVLVLFGLFIGRTGILLKRQMDSLKQRTLQLNTILDTAASAIITIDKNADILSFNHAAESIFGYTVQEILGKNIKMLMPDSIGAHHDGYIKRFIETGEANIIGKRREVEAQRKNGQVFPVLLRVNPMKIGGELYFSGVIDDISETKNLQTQLVQAQKLEAIGQLASGVAHEINTPIQYIGDNLSSLYDNFADISGFHESLAALADESFKSRLMELDDKYDMEFILEDSPKAITQAREGVERVAEIVRAMKTFSHIDAGQEAQFINLHNALNSALTISRNTYKYFADIETDFSPEVTTIECFASELNQVLLNLIINASHAIEEKKAGKGIIRITTRKLGEQFVEITISDNGMGIPVEIREKVFNLFFTTKEVGKGTGQGLSLAHNIVVEKHAGKLFFESQVGTGTTFHIQLPIRRT